MIKTNRMDEVLKELGELYELNREIQKFSFVSRKTKTVRGETECNSVLRGTELHSVVMRTERERPTSNNQITESGANNHECGVYI